MSPVSEDFDTKYIEQQTRPLTSGLVDRYTPKTDLRATFAG
jgi:hypothetical protein